MNYVIYSLPQWKRRKKESRRCVKSAIVTAGWLMKVKKKEMKERTNLVSCILLHRKRKEKKTWCEVSSRNSILTWARKIKERQKERMKIEMSVAFVGVFEIFKKERNKSKNRKKDRRNWGICNFPASKTTTKASKTKRDWFQNYYFIVV